MNKTPIDSPNARIDFYDTHAKKTLKKKASKEKRERFRKECSIIKDIQNNDLKIVFSTVFSEPFNFINDYFCRIEKIHRRLI